ncbi:MAG: hypothetical protein B7Z75_09680 [Acidocella sp. 20-57-95]|nr:MAG: hypothetical protein B7Z75_09680 [Acidocella sp. 20-57-95]OYV62062.1 MAG: hypothetical protein B7Z71_02785 [Acidocella sp. 21-58-7]HQT65411.1 AIM24 family protein [Acidocella sp.]HQU04086.1 AIM24 family protein [Acidocella sp.]
MQHNITGSTMPVVQITLNPGEKIISESGEFSWMTSTVQLHTTTMTGGATGLFGVLGRALAGGSLFMTEYTAVGGPGLVAFAAKIPGTIQQVDIPAGHSYMIHRHGFLCASEGMNLGIGFQQKLGAGLLGGDGFIMQKLSGPCSAFVELGGESVMYDLRPGESLQVHPGHVGMFQDSVNFEMTMLPGIRNKLFGGDGLFVARLTGPGRIWLQSMSVANLAHALAPYLDPKQTGQS